MNTKTEIINLLQKILEKLGIENPVTTLTYPTHVEMGDYTTNVAMMYAKELARKPLDLALEIKEDLVSKQLRHILRIDVIAPGFINFFFDEHYFNKAMGSVLSTEKRVLYKGEKFFIEHTQPNPFKEFHMGHLMNNTIGESLVRIIKANGAEVKTATYHGDKGLHVAKSVWAMQEGFSLKEAYREGYKSYEENEDVQKKIIEINKKIYDGSDSKINKIYEDGRKLSFEYFSSIYERLGSEFDYHFYESESGEIGKKIVIENIGKVFEEGENGAIIFKGENFGLHTRVFLNSDGLPTYEAKEVGLAEIKKEKYLYDTSVTITANEQDAFFKVVECAIGQVFLKLNGKLKHLSHGMLKLSTGKMSSRTGNIISAESLISEVKGKVLAKLNLRDLVTQSDEDRFEEKTSDRDFSPTEKNEVAEIVAISAIKYSILRQAIGGDIIFDFDKSLSFEGDSGPYLQYATVRANSILKKAKTTNLDIGCPNGWKTTNLERLFERFPGVIEKAGLEYAPHYLVTHLTELASEFNSFYAGGKIIDEADPQSSYKIALVRTLASVMAYGLNLLGIKVPSKM